MSGYEKLSFKVRHILTRELRGIRLDLDGQNRVKMVCKVSEDRISWDSGFSKFKGNESVESGLYICSVVSEGVSLIFDS